MLHSEADVICSEEDLEMLSLLPQLDGLHVLELSSGIRSVSFYLHLPITPIGFCAYLGVWRDNEGTYPRFVCCMVYQHSGIAKGMVKTLTSNSTAGESAWYSC